MFGVNCVSFVITNLILFNFHAVGQLSQSLFSLFREMGYDGIVLESWSRWVAYGILRDPDMRNLVTSFLPCFEEAVYYLSHKK